MSQPKLFSCTPNSVNSWLLLKKIKPSYILYALTQDSLMQYSSPPPTVLLNIAVFHSTEPFVSFVRDSQDMFFVVDVCLYV